MTAEPTVRHSKHGDVDTLIIDTDHATAEISLFGAQVLSFKPKYDNRERLWLSPHALFDNKRAIRGGAPLCWPWFADDHQQPYTDLPSHGYLRTQNWQLVDAVELEQGTKVTLNAPVTSAYNVESSCSVKLHLTVGERLVIALETHNQGLDSFSFRSAIHTYFYVADILSATIDGISGPYKDKLQDGAEVDTPTPYRIEGQTDRIHLCNTTETTLQCNESATFIGHKGHDSIVVWNPWRSAASIPDMDAFGYKHMLCIETANTEGVTLQPGQSHSLEQIIG